MFQVNNDVFTLDNLRKIIDDNKKPDRELNNGPQIAFLPEGVHKIRWFFDPTGALFREGMAGKVGRTRFMCPDFAARTDRIGKYPECAICKHQASINQFKNKCRYNCMAYGYLYETKNPSEYWQPNNAYVILGNSKLRKALLEMLDNLIDDGADMLMGMLTPTVKGFVSSTSVTRGTQGGVAIQVLTRQVEPISLDEWFIPLHDVTYMPNSFDPEVYDAAVEEYFENVEEVEPEDTTTDDEDEETTSVVEDEEEDLEEDEEEEEEEDVPVVVETVTPKAKTSTKKKVTPKKTVTLPDDITIDMLPEGCPGWAEYSPSHPVCVLCDYNIDCMTDAEAK